MTALAFKGEELMTRSIPVRILLLMLGLGGGGVKLRMDHDNYDVASTRAEKPGFTRLPIPDSLLSVV